MADIFSKANEEFVNENYKRAVELYTEAIDADGSRDEFFCSRAQAHIKLENFNEAKEDCCTALSLNSKSSKATLRKGVALFNLEDYQSALDAFKEGQKLNETDSSYDSWIKKCEEKMKSLSMGDDSIKLQSQVPVPSEPPTEHKPVPILPSVRHDWYQTPTHVVITVLLKNVNKDSLVCDIQENSLSVIVKRPDLEDYSLQLHLAHTVVPQQSTYKVTPSKIEIKLKKSEGLQWTKLEGDGQNTEIKSFTQDAQRYPSSSHYTRNWDKLAKEVGEEEKNEKKEGDAALNSLFQQIYSDGSDEVRKAMIKSFYESGGTVLSTNWNEVGTEKVDVKPPDGMEFKKWDS
ncbi:protein SGT1 homolog [Gigantopelta aegis]|uniref:protein SGT1 homolog n=1 Tax=Gigantopelta aegis TaxID=1735272 RepID=UPI001B887EB0|nr:protein SGT1 homolog [Gigantopelta aegis]